MNRRLSSGSRRWAAWGLAACCAAAPVLIAGCNRGPARMAKAMVKFNRGQELQDAGNLPAAAEQFREAIELHPDLHPARLQLGKLLMALGQPDEGIRNLKYIVDADPMDRQALHEGRVRQSLRGQGADRAGEGSDPDHPQRR